MFFLLLLKIHLPWPKFERIKYQKNNIYMTDSSIELNIYKISWEKFLLIIVI